MMAVGEYGEARIRLERRISSKPQERDYILSRERYLIAALADGYPQLADEVTNEIYDLLRTQGLNEDRTTAAVVFHEGVKTWKGEPFEQAMGYIYVAIQKASRGDWDNARVAANESLFLLKDFGDNERGDRKSTEDIARAAIEAEGEPDAGDEEYFDTGYQPIETNFTLGYLLAGLASKMMGREDEARDNFNKAVRYEPELRDLTDRLLGDSYNTVFVVEAGLGPQKIRYGRDQALARFVPRHGSDQARLELLVQGLRGGLHPVACDVNTLALDHMWNNLEDVRLAKSRVGSALVFAGATTTYIGAASGSETAAWAGLGVLVAGLVTKGSARADLTHAELLPQRVYVVPVILDEPDLLVEIVIDTGVDRWGVTLPGVDPPSPADRVRLHYVRLPVAPPKWLSAGLPLYANDHLGHVVPGDDLPYLLGGRCVRTPTLESLRYYQSHGNLLDLTLEDLRSMYFEEGWWWDPAMKPKGRDALHVLEGGRSLLSPQPGTVGYARLFVNEHRSYQPRSRRAREIAEAYRRQLDVQPAGSP